MGFAEGVEVHGLDAGDLQGAALGVDDADPDVRELVGVGDWFLFYRLAGAAEPAAGAPERPAP